MGCGGSKSAVMPLEENGQMNGQTISNGHAKAAAEAAIRRASAHHLQGDDPPEEQLNSLAPLRPLNVPSNKIAQPLAFEVAIQDDDESLIKKHPPRRFQKLEDQQQALTHELIDEKQAEAEQRRNNIISQRVQSAKQRIPKKRTPDMDRYGENEEEMIETMRRENSGLEL